MEAPVVIGIDPGSVRTGWGVVKQEAGGFRLVDCGIIRTMAGAGGSQEFSARLARIYRELVECLRRIRPQEAAIEQPVAPRPTTLSPDYLSWTASSPYR